MHPEGHHGHGDQPHHTSPEAVAQDRPYIGVGIVTISDSASRGERDDLSGPAIKDNLHRFGGTLRHQVIVPDEQAIISQTLIHLVENLHLDLVLTTGGTGLSPRDRTPQATQAVLDYEVPGLAEAMRAESAKKAPMAYLSRAVAGVRQESLIVNLPGSPRACVEIIEVLAPLLPHAIQILRGDVGEHKPTDQAP
jgi:molybdenum cofactor synthesis domain-containing protein